MCNLGTIYQTKGELDRALEYSRDAWKILQEAGLRHAATSVLANIGLIYQDKGELDTALKYLLDALKVFDEIQATREQAEVLRRLAQLRDKLGRTEFSAACLKLGMPQTDMDKLATRLDSVSV